MSYINIDHRDAVLIESAVADNYEPVFKSLIKKEVPEVVRVVTLKQILSDCTRWFLSWFY